MAALSTLDRYTSPSSWLKGAQALVDEGLETGVKMTLCGITQVGAGFVAGFGMQRWGDMAHPKFFFGAPADVVIGAALVGVGATKLGGEASEYIMSAGLGVLSAAAGRYGAEAAVAHARRLSQKAA